MVKYGRIHLLVTVATLKVCERSVLVPVTRRFPRVSAGVDFSSTAVATLRASLKTNALIIITMTRAGLLGVPHAQLLSSLAGYVTRNRDSIETTSDICDPYERLPGHIQLVSRRGWHLGQAASSML